MGSWNKTCGLSNLPIHVYEPVMVFTLVQNIKIDNFCYSTALYSPVLLPFYSHYNDYGAGERSSGVGLPLIIDGLKERLIEQEQGENPYHDIPVKRDSFDEDKYWEAIHEQRLKIGHYDGGVRDVQFVMFHKRVVDHILENHTMQRFIQIGDKYVYVDYKFADILASLPPVIEQLMSSQDDFSWFRPLESLSRMDDNLAAEWLRHSDTYRYSNLIDINVLIHKLVKQNADDLLANVLIDHLTAKFIDGFMMSTRKVWIPGCHEGSQSSEDDAYRSLMSAMTHVLDEDKSKYREEYGNDDQMDLFLDA